MYRKNEVTIVSKEYFSAVTKGVKYLTSLGAELWSWWCYFKSRTPQDMDGTLTLISANSKTTKDFVTKFSAFLQLRKT